MAKRASTRTNRRRMVGDTGPKERWQHDPVRLEPLENAKGTSMRRARVYSRNPLDTYFKRAVIDHKQKAAGEVLGRLWQTAALEPRLTARYEEYVDTNRRDGAIVRKSEAYERWRHAMQAVGPVAAEEVIAVCCTERTIKGSAQIEILRRGLSVLAKHFGI